jgi:IS4 transposase
MGGRSGGSAGEDANPNSDRTDHRFLNLSLFVTIALFFTLEVFFVLGRFVDLDLLETNDVYRRKEDLEIPVSKLYDMMDIN